MLSPYSSVDYLSGTGSESKFKFRDYPPSSSLHSLQVRGAMGELQRESNRMEYQRRSSNASPINRLNRDSPSSESMDSVVETSHLSNRKKRRGVIEKRRRDRINNSLNELRRLVPSAFEKQGSTKLEKAEILQMTVEHLKAIHTKGINCDPNAIDPHTMGFQECAAEVARFLQCATHELSNPDPLRSRLMSHLQCYSAQRESLKQQAAWHQSPFPTGPTGLIPPPPPPGVAGSSLFLSSSDNHTSTSMTSSAANVPLQTPSCLGTSGMSYSSSSSGSSSFTTPTFAAHTFNQYPSFSNSAAAMQYMNAANSQTGYPTTRPHRPWPEMIC